jgi:hypothetical protein
MKYIGNEMNLRWGIWIIGWKGKAKLQDSAAIISW